MKEIANNGANKFGVEKKKKRARPRKQRAEKIERTVRNDSMAANARNGRDVRNGNSSSSVPPKKRVKKETYFHLVDDFVKPLFWCPPLPATPSYSNESHHVSQSNAVNVHANDAEVPSAESKLAADADVGGGEAMPMPMEVEVDASPALELVPTSKPTVTSVKQSTAVVDGVHVDLAAPPREAPLETKLEGQMPRTRATPTGAISKASPPLLTLTLTPTPTQPSSSPPAPAPLLTTNLTPLQKAYHLRLHSQQHYRFLLQKRQSIQSQMEVKLGELHNALRESHEREKEALKKLREMSLSVLELELKEGEEGEGGSNSNSNNGVTNGTEMENIREGCEFNFMVRTIRDQFDDIREGGSKEVDGDAISGAIAVWVLSISRNSSNAGLATHDTHASQVTHSSQATHDPPPHHLAVLSSLRPTIKYLSSLEDYKSKANQAKQAVLSDPTPATKAEKGEKGNESSVRAKEGSGSGTEAGKDGKDGNDGNETGHSLRTVPTVTSTAISTASSTATNPTLTLSDPRLNPTTYLTPNDNWHIMLGQFRRYRKWYFENLEELRKLKLAASCAVDDDEDSNDVEVIDVMRAIMTHGKYHGTTMSRGSNKSCVMQTTLKLGKPMMEPKEFKEPKEPMSPYNLFLNLESEYVVWCLENDRTLDGETEEVEHLEEAQQVKEREEVQTVEEVGDGVKESPESQENPTRGRYKKDRLKKYWNTIGSGSAGGWGRSGRAGRAADTNYNINTSIDNFEDCINSESLHRPSKYASLPLRKHWYRMDIQRNNRRKLNSMREALRDQLNQLQLQCSDTKVEKDEKVGSIDSIEMRNRGRVRPLQQIQQIRRKLDQVEEGLARFKKSRWKTAAREIKNYCKRVAEEERGRYHIGMVRYERLMRMKREREREGDNGKIVKKGYAGADAGAVAATSKTQVLDALYEGIEGIDIPKLQKWCLFQQQKFYHNGFRDVMMDGTNDDTTNASATNANATHSNNLNRFRKLIYSGFTFDADCPDDAYASSSSLDSIGAGAGRRSGLTERNKLRSKMSGEIYEAITGGSWEEGIRQILAFKKKNGHVFIPRDDGRNERDDSRDDAKGTQESRSNQSTRSSRINRSSQINRINRRINRPNLPEFVTKIRTLLYHDALSPHRVLHLKRVGLYDDLGGRVLRHHAQFARRGRSSRGEEEVIRVKKRFCEAGKKKGVERMVDDRGVRTRRVEKRCLTETTCPCIETAIFGHNRYKQRVEKRAAYFLRSSVKKTSELSPRAPTSAPLEQLEPLETTVSAAPPVPSVPPLPPMARITDLKKCYWDWTSSGKNRSPPGKFLEMDEIREIGDENASERTLHL